MGFALCVGFSGAVDIHSGHDFLTVALRHAEEFPAVALVKAGMIGQKIERRNAHRRQIIADKPQQTARQPSPP